MMPGRLGARRKPRLLTACAMAAVIGAASPAFAQSVPTSAELSGPMLLTAEDVIYDFNNETVTVVGGVQIRYDGYTMVAQRVIFNRRTGRLLAQGGVQLTQPDGTVVHADEIDVTDDLADGFVTSLRLETTDNTRFAAARATRQDGNIATFERGVYTACEPCLDKPDKPPTWQVKAETIVWNQQRKTIRFEKARLELFGFSLAALPAFEIADHTVKRKSGFLMPTANYNSRLGLSADIRYFWAIAPNIDATLLARPYSRQGVLGAGTFRHRLNSGQYSVTIAGIDQQNPDAFGAATENAGQTGRAMIGSKGRFQINPRWTFGWDVLEQTDKNFSRTYGIEGYEDYRRASEIYLTGLGDRSWFDLRASRFEVQEDATTGLHERQALALPSLDYRKVFEEPVAGGELQAALNGRFILRDENDFSGNTVRGISGNNGRLTASLDWQRTFLLGGLAVTPFGGVRADALTTDYDNGAWIGLQPVAYEIQDSTFRGMATAGLDIRYPVLFTSANSSHVLEPRVQIIARPDAAGQDALGLPNEDAQSLVFEASNLFDRDKFSGLDRVEGGVRVNAGLRYSGTFADGVTADALFGQSYHVAGDNPYAAPDLAFVGAYSGLETDVSDFVASASLGRTGPDGRAWRAGIGARFDEKTFDLRRTDITGAYGDGTFGLNARYSYIEAQPDYGLPIDRQEITAGASVKFAEYWTANADVIYDLEANDWRGYGLGLRYDDECFTFALAYREEHDPVTSNRKQTIGFRLSLRTLAEIGAGPAFQR
jgi:LPS-assembly protein